MFCFNKASVSEEEKIDSFAIVLNSKFPAGIAVFSLFSTSSQFVYVDLLICVAPRERQRQTDRQTDRQRQKETETETETKTDRDRQSETGKQTDTQIDRDRQKHRDRETETGRERENSNSESLILNDSSV